MSYANHPLFCTSVPVPNQFQEVATTGWTCTSSTGDSAFTFNPKTLVPGITTGDLMILRIHSSASASSTLASFRPRTGYPAWSVLYGATARSDGNWHGYRTFVSAPQMYLFYKFYESSDDTTHDFYKGATSTGCYSLTVLRNVNKTVPFDCPGATGDHGTTNWNNYHDFPWQIPALPIATTTYNVLLDGSFYYTGGTSPTEVTDASFVLPSGVEIVSSQHDPGITGGYGRKLILLKGSAPTSAHQNLIKSITPSVSSGTPTVGSASNLRLASSSAPIAELSGMYEFEIAGDSTSQTHYMEWDFEATTGTQYIAEALSGSYGSNSLALVFAIVNPDASLECGVLSMSFSISSEYGQGGDASERDGDFANPVDYMNVWLKRSPSSFSDPHGCKTLFAFTASQTGTHKFRVYVVQDGTAGDTPPYSFIKTFDAGAASWVVTQTYFYGAAISQKSSGMPSNFVATSSSGQSAGTADSRVAPLSVPIAAMGAYSQPSGTVTDMKRACVFTNLVHTGHEPSPVRIAYDDYYHLRYLNIDATDNMEVPAPSGMCGPCVALTGAVIRPTRPVPAKYYATEETASPSAGKYYAEITIGTTDSADNILVAVAPTHAATGYPFSSTAQSVDNTLGGGTVYSSSGDIWYNRTGSMGTTFTTFTAGDIIGVLIDYSATNGAISWYHNGTLQDTVTIYGGANDIGFVPDPDLNVVVAFTYGNGACFPACTFNLTGPFTYTKPSGSVAYDYRNEVA